MSEIGEIYDKELTFSQRVVITAAIDGKTMTEIASRHNMQISYVRQAWTRIAEKFAAALDDESNHLADFRDVHLRQIFK